MESSAKFLAGEIKQLFQIKTWGTEWFIQRFFAEVVVLKHERVGVTPKARQSQLTAHSRWGYELVCVWIFVCLPVCVCLSVSDYPSCSEINTSVCGDRPSMCPSLTHTHTHIHTCTQPHTHTRQTVTVYAFGALSNSHHILNHSICTLNKSELFTGIMTYHLPLHLWV